MGHDRISLILSICLHRSHLILVGLIGKQQSIWFGTSKVLGIFTSLLGQVRKGYWDTQMQVMVLKIWDGNPCQAMSLLLEEGQSAGVLRSNLLLHSLLLRPNTLP